jgi:hypothetical protein
LLQGALGELFRLVLGGPLLDLEEHMARTDLLLLAEIIPVILVVELDVFIRHAHPRGERLWVDQDVGHDPPLGQPVGILVRVEIGLRLVVGDRGLEAVRVHFHVFRLHLLVPEAIFPLRLLLAHHDSVGHEGLETLAKQLLAELVLVVLHASVSELETASHLLGAHEMTVLVLPCGVLGECAGQALVVHGESKALGLDPHEALVDELFEDLVFEAHPTQLGRVHPSMGETFNVLLLLKIGLPELPDGDGDAADEAQARRGASFIGFLEGWDVQDDEAQNDDHQREVQPALVTPHETQGHDVSRGTLRLEVPQNYDSSLRLRRPQPSRPDGGKEPLSRSWIWPSCENGPKGGRVARGPTVDYNQRP